MTLAPGAQLAKYVIEGELGRGGFGVIYVARDTALDRSIALKVLRPEHVTTQDVVQRFLQEARAAAKIDHPGIVTVHECGVADDGTVYIAMELLRGETLTHRLGRGPLPLDTAIAICRQAASALGAAHRAAIVHRDLKPDNLMLCPDRAVVGGERVKVLDFGIAKLAESMWQSSMQTHQAVVLGTPMYMSPEQCRSTARVDARSDIYTLGCIVYQLVCGRPPYDGDAGQLIAKHQLAPVPEPLALAPGLPPSLAALVRGMLAKEPEHRPQSMEQVEAALDACFGGGPPVSGSWPPPALHVPAAAPGAMTMAGGALLPQAAPTPSPGMAMQMPMQVHVQTGPQTTLSSGVHGGPTHGGGRRRGVVIGGTALAVIAVAVAIAASVGGGERTPAVGSAEVIASAAPPVDASAVVAVVPVPVPADAAVATPPLPPDAAVPKPKAKPPVPPKPAQSQSQSPSQSKSQSKSTSKPDEQTAGAADPCDLAGHTQRGQAASKHAAHGEAIVEFEAALRCKPGDPQLVALAYGEACVAHFTKRARHFFSLLPTSGALSKDAMRDVCTRLGIDPARQHPLPRPTDNE